MAEDGLWSKPAAALCRTRLCHALSRTSPAKAMRLSRSCNDLRSRRTIEHWSNKCNTYSSSGHTILSFSCNTLFRYHEVARQCVSNVQSCESFNSTPHCAALTAHPSNAVFPKAPRQLCRIFLWLQSPLMLRRGLLTDCRHQSTSSPRLRTISFRL